MQTIGFLGPAFFLSQLSNVNGVTGAVLCMMGAQVGGPGGRDGVIGKSRHKHAAVTVIWAFMLGVVQAEHT
jgi:hypothetical protein